MRRSLTPLETHLTYRDGTHWFLRTMDFRGHHSIMLTLRLHHLLLRSWSAHWFVYYNIYNASLKKRNHLPIVRTLQSQLTYQSNTNWKVRSYPPPFSRTPRHSVRIQSALYKEYGPVRIQYATAHILQEASTALIDFFNCLFSPFHLANNNWLFPLTFLR